MLKSFQLKGIRMNKVDEVDSAGNPICVVTYSSGLTENSIALDGRCAGYSDDEIRKVLAGQENRPLPMQLNPVTAAFPEPYSYIDQQPTALGDASAGHIGRASGNHRGKGPVHGYGFNDRLPTPNRSGGVGTGVPGVDKPFGRWVVRKDKKGQNIRVWEVQGFKNLYI